MRLKDKLIRRNCPVCDEEITLGTSSLNKKINCPKCRQTVIIPDGGGPAPAAPEKPAAKKSAPKEKRRVRTAPAIRDSPEPFPEPRIIIESYRAGQEPPDSPSLISQEEPVETVETMATVVPASEKHNVVYCLCHGVLTRRPDSAVCSFAPATCCIYANQPGS